MYHTSNGIQTYFVSATDYGDAILQFLMKIQKNQVDILLLLETISDIDYDPEDEADDEYISDRAKKLNNLLIQIMAQISVEQLEEFVDKNFEDLIDLIDKYKNEISFDVIQLDF